MLVRVTFQQAVAAQEACVCIQSKFAIFGGGLYQEQGR